MALFLQLKKKPNSNLEDFIMDYRTQLLDNLWKNKRTIIIQRDDFKCQNCRNESYKENYPYGLIFSNNLNLGVAQSVLINENYLVNIWDFKNNKIKVTFTNESIFSTQKSYIAFYKDEIRYPKLLALKYFDNKKIKLNSNILDIIKEGIKAKITIETFEEIYRPEKITDIWEFVLGLHVHHKYYQHGMLAWEYPNESLITLCWKCHELLHSNSKVPILDFKGNEIGALTPCKKCFGAGIFPEFVHVQSGICFRCHGAKYEELKN